MSKTATIVLGSLTALGIGLGSTGTYLAYMNQPSDAVQGDLATVDLSTIAGKTVDPNAGDFAAELTNVGDMPNTDIRWQCGKVGSANPFVGTWSKIAGAVAFNPSQQKLVAMQLTFLLDSFTGVGNEYPAPAALTNKVRKSWFDTESHPIATFTAEKLIPKSEAGDLAEDAQPIEGWTHVIYGTFDLNGVAQPLTVPARVAMSEGGIAIDAAFSIDRSEYNIDGDAAGSLVDDQVRITVAIAATLGGDAVTAKLNQRINEQADLISDQRMRLIQMELEVAYLREREAAISPRVNTLWQTTGDLDFDRLPASFTDRVVYGPNQKPRFEMVLVPGDRAKGIDPFYMSATEVTWEMFEKWAYSNDIGPIISARLQQLGLRPSPLYATAVPLHIGMRDRPAISMSRTTAQAFCLWLSEQTGRTYRLPTEAEWELAVKLGGDLPSEPDQIPAFAHFVESAKPYVDPFAPHDPFAETEAEQEQALIQGEESEKPLSTRPAGSGKPNALGIYDLIGNAAEWVIPEDPAVKKVRGGHFMMPAADYTHNWEEVENQDDWNATYPQKPASDFWYKDFYFTGIRLVCEPVNVTD